MGSLSNYAENKILNHIFKVSTFTPPSSIYIALSTANPTEDGSGLAEPSGNAYARVEHNAWDAAVNRATENTGVIEFPEATGSWGTVTHWAMFDTASGGNMLAYGALNDSQAIDVGDNPSIQDGALDIQWLTGTISTYLANAILDHTFGNTVYDATANLYVALSVNSNPLDDASGMVEPVGNNYARVQHNDWTTSTAASTSNDGAVTFPQASASWGTITHWALYDADAEGNMLIYAAVTTSRAIGRNDTPNFANGAIVVKCD